MSKTAHYCQGRLPTSLYGAAIERCVTDPDGRFWATNSKVSSQVAFCPYCGTKAPIQPAVLPVEDFLYDV